jgi:hypothetical protein
MSEPEFSEFREFTEYQKFIHSSEEKVLLCNSAGQI